VTSLDAKLESFDRHASEAVDDLIGWLMQHRDDLIAVARGRHVTGHYRYGDKGLFEHDIDGLKAEAAEELGDAIVYKARELYLEGVNDGDGAADAERSVAG
jgi:hypothetical protein